MKKVKAFLIAFGLTVSVSAWAGIPGEGDCDGWLNLLNYCEGTSSGQVYGMTCSEIYYHWRDCQQGNC